MKIKIASTGHDMTGHVDSAGHRPRYWIVYDTVSRSFEVIDNQRSNSETNLSNRCVDQPGPARRDGQSVAGEKQSVPVAAVPAGQFDGEDTVLEAIDAILESATGREDNRSFGAGCEVTAEDLSRLTQDGFSVCDHKEYDCHC